MAYCRKCGAQLKADDVFCFMCGQAIDKQANAEAFVPAGINNANPYAAPGVAVAAAAPEQVRPQMTKEESIALAEKLRDEYSSIERLQREIDDNQTALKKPVVLSGKRYSMFRFFWPFFIYAYIALNAVYLIGAIISAANDDSEGIIGALFLGIAAAVGLLIFGGIHASRKRDRLNEQLGEEEYMIRKRQRDLETRTAEVMKKLSSKKKAVSEYQNLVPIRFRSKHYMDRVLVLIQTDRAAGFYEAIDMLE